MIDRGKLTHARGPTAAPLRASSSRPASQRPIDPLPWLGGALLLFSATWVAGDATSPPRPYAIVGTGQTECFDHRSAIPPPKPGEPYYGQDAQSRQDEPSYELVCDGRVVRDRLTGLEWTRSADTDGDGRVEPSDKLSWSEAFQWVERLNRTRWCGHNDWRLPSIQELYSLILFSGVDPRVEDQDPSRLRPFIDTRFFVFRYGAVDQGERIIDAQYWSSTPYVAPTADQKVFGVNFADGRIKAYPGRWARHYVLAVRGNPAYGRNEFVDNGDGTITDRATGRMWTRDDSGVGMDWPTALAWVQEQNRRGHLGHRDWRLPTAKELQSIVDYTRAPDRTGSPAIAPVFRCTAITNEAGQLDWPYYWTSTTHISTHGAGSAVYIAFGRGAGWLSGRARSEGPPLRDRPGVSSRFTDVHGAGCQRSDPKVGDPSAYPYGRGPQGDAVRIRNFVRMVRTVVQTSNVATSAQTHSDTHAR